MAGAVYGFPVESFDVEEANVCTFHLKGVGFDDFQAYIGGCEDMISLQTGVFCNEISYEPNAEANRSFEC